MQQGKTVRVMVTSSRMDLKEIQCLLSLKLTEYLTPTICNKRMARTGPGKEGINLSQKKSVRELTSELQMRAVSLEKEQGGKLQPLL